MQLHLEGLDPPQKITSAPERDEPLIWVRRLRVVRDLRQEGGVIRDVELRRGLNIVWAPPLHSSDPNALFKSGVQGHTAGKTTFSRLLRYALGESGLGTEATRRRIREKLPNGGLLAEVVVAGELWTVARPFAIGPHPFCAKGVTIDEAIGGSTRVSFRAFLEAISACAVEDLPARRFPTTDELVQWAHVLPWLTRDQECRFSDFLKWRHSSSDSDAPSLDVEQRQFLVRSIMGLITDAERDERRRNALLLEGKAQASGRAPLLEHEATAAHRRVRTLLKMDLPDLSTGFFGSQARRSLDAEQAALMRELAELEERDERAQLQADLEHAVAAETEATRDHRDAEERLEMESGALAVLTGQQQDALAERLPPGRHYCSVPMTLARERACPLASGEPVGLQGKLAKQALGQQVDNQRVIIASLRAEVTRTRVALARAEAATKTARASFLRCATAFASARERLLRKEESLKQAEVLVTEAERAANEAEENKALVNRLTDEIAESYQWQEHHRRGNRSALDHFSAAFNYVTRALLGDGVEARIEAAGRSLSLVVEQNGVRESAALATVKLLAFDLAALTESIQGRGSFPRFLLHDGPREADMSMDIYERLFMFAGKLEECFSGEPGFQYIITTTTPPPQPFSTEPWLRLELAGEPAQERFFRMDF